MVNVNVGFYLINTPWLDVIRNWIGIEGVGGVMVIGKPTILMRTLIMMLSVIVGFSAGLATN
ncbi:hypothetical protein ACFLUO_00920 [Chloroflexota bacterium]